MSERITDEQFAEWSKLRRAKVEAELACKRASAEVEAFQHLMIIEHKMKPEDFVQNDGSIARKKAETP